MRFYVDANVSPQAVNVLNEMGYDALTAREARIETHDDEDQIAVARKQDRILITHDQDFLDDRRFPLHECPTLVVCSFGTGTKDEILATFNCLRILEWSGQMPGGQVPSMGVKIDANPSQWTEKTRYQEGFSDRYKYRIHQDEWQVWVED
jgi:predicted nuclease of predicted toxin-antitoxin system